MEENKKQTVEMTAEESESFKLFQEKQAKENLHVVTDWTGSSSADSEQREESLQVFDLLEKIHTALADVDGEHFREFDISGSTTNHNHEEILENIETYSYVGYRDLSQH